MQKPVIVSACLVGEKCRYDGKSCRDPALEKKLIGLKIITVCPEQLGGLSTPRPRARIVGKRGAADGNDVVDGEARVVTFEGKDVTKAFLDGAREALRIARETGGRVAVFKAKSPSCGCGSIFAENFSHKKAGDGTTTAMLKKNGIKVYTEENFRSIDDV